jgi:hypothetical protein
VINIRDISVRCGNCLNYQTLTAYATRDGWNAYTYECDAESCDPERTRTIVEVPVAIDEFAQSHPDCGGGCSTR